MGKKVARSPVKDHEEGLGKALGEPPLGWEKL